MFPFSHFMPSFLLYATGGSGEKHQKKKWAILVSTLVVVTAALVFFLTLAFDDPNSGKSINANYAWVELRADTLRLCTRYDTGGTPIEFGRHTIVAKDKEFTELLPLKKRQTQKGDYVYEFDAEALSWNETLYIKPAILFTHTEIMPVSVPAAEGELATIRINKPSRSRAKDAKAEENWFTVESIDMEATKAGSYTAKITLDTQAKHMPRSPKLVSGDTSCDGDTTPYFDENDNLDYVEILFTLPAGSEDEAAAFVEAATLKISNALTQVDADDISVTDYIPTSMTSTTEQGTRKLSFVIC